VDRKVLAGALLFVGAVQFIIGMILAEVSYPGYNTSTNFISDLGAQQTSAPIFNASVSLLGILVIAASYLIWKEFSNVIVSALFFLSGIGSLGVGIFPESAGTIHMVVSLIAFLFGGLSAIASVWIVRPPFSYLSILLGAIGLIALGLFASGSYLGIGPGGMERVVAYPIILWLAGFGGYLMSPYRQELKKIK
jgi:hypothetical membrane protein